jgi:2'-hydroxyisoflavone reductase
VPSSFLESNGVPNGSLMPWVPQDGPWAGLARLAPQRAFANGMKFRPFAETVVDTLEWWNSLPQDRRDAMRAGLRGGSLEMGPASIDQQMAREAEILEAWQAMLAS